MDSETIRTVARLARQRAERRGTAGHGDGLERLGAARALLQLAADLDVTAAEFEKRPGRRRPRG